jgi:hypothetical protein
MHKANLMDIKPEEKCYHCASSFDIEAINKSNLSRVISPEMPMCWTFNENWHVRVKIFQTLNKLRL